MNDADCRSQIIKNIEHIGTSPAISLRISQEVNRFDADLTIITSLLMDDPTICAQILKVANSTFFATRKRVATISQAVINLGLNNVKQVLFAIEIIGVFRAESATTKFNEEQFWRNGIASGFLAAEIGRLQKIPVDNETLYIAGLLKNIGVLAIRQFLPGAFDTIVRMTEEKKIDFGSASRKVISMSHREVACLICKKWNLPDIIVHAICEGALQGPEQEKAAPVRKLLKTADALLSLKKYAAWDTWNRVALPPEIPGIDDICEHVFCQVELLYEQLWR